MTTMSPHPSPRSLGAIALRLVLHPAQHCHVPLCFDAMRRGFRCGVLCRCAVSVCCVGVLCRCAVSVCCVGVL